MKRLAFSVLMVLLVVATMEATARVAYRISFGAWYSWRDLRQSLGGNVVEEHVRQQQGSVEILHPFLGYVLDSDDAQRAASIFGKALALDNVSPEMVHGFLGNADLNSPRIPGKKSIRILLTGGSVAQSLGLSHPLEREFEQMISQFGVTVFTGAIGSYKQPQQFLLLS
jgi:hypothetical protein